MTRPTQTTTSHSDSEDSDDGVEPVTDETYFYFKIQYLFRDDPDMYYMPLIMIEHIWFNFLSSDEERRSTIALNRNGNYPIVGFLQDWMDEVVSDSDVDDDQ